MQDIVLCTFNARYTHTSLGLRYLYANLNELQSSCVIKEFVINSQVADAIESVLRENPKIVGIGAYIWNANEVGEFIETIKIVAPHVVLVVGGPEASYFPHRVSFEPADYFVLGEGDVVFYKLCQNILNNKAPKEKIIKAQMVNLENIKLPYAFYNENDIKNRQCYVEASRGCPYSCEFCLSSLDKKVRKIDTDIFLKEMETLWNKGVRSFKFIDRTFNQGVKTANRLMDFFLSKKPPYFIHFEVIPDNFPDSIKQRIKEFPSASLQLEIGIQTLNLDVSKNINRKLNIEKIKDNLKFLENETKAHLHVDLIVGLPGENLEQFGKNLDMLYSMTKCEIQLGILKKLSGTTLNRHDKIHGMVYSNRPPYDILKNNLISFEMMQKMKRFARFWDMIYNSGNFKRTVTYLFINSKVFNGFSTFSEWMYENTQSTWHISLDRLAHLLFIYIADTLHVDKKEIRVAIIEDITRVDGRKLPKFLRAKVENKKSRKEKLKILNQRQLKHIAQ